MSTVLLDANVLIALTVAEHEHHDRASRWFVTIDEFAVCPMVEGALIRFLLRLGESAATAQAVLTGIHAHPRCEFWSDSLSYADVHLAAVRGHRQVTDGYLAALARARRARLATFDKPLANAHVDASLLIP